MGKKPQNEPALLDVSVLEKIRTAIINGMKYGKFILSEDYKLSAIKPYRTVFMLETLSKRATDIAVRQCVKQTFKYRPKMKFISTFIELDVESEYRHLLELEPALAK